MRVGFRLILSLVPGLILVSLLFSYYQVAAEKRALKHELERRAELLAESSANRVEPLLQGNARDDLQRLVERFRDREHLAGVAVYEKKGTLLAASSGLAARLTSSPPVVREAIEKNGGRGEFTHLGETPVHIYALPLHRQEETVGGLAIVHDTAYIQAQSGHVWQDVLVLVLAQGLVIGLITLLIVRQSIVGPIARTTQWMKALRQGRTSSHPRGLNSDLLQPLAHELTTFAASLTAARAAAEKEARLRLTAESSWTAERLSVHVRSKLKGCRLFVVSNREPYMHNRQGKSVEVMVPASGLVTALEPILRACDGTWIAHGSGNADHETVNERNSLRVPPEEPRYTLRRVWLSQEEEEGYYYGFANEGLWPLCHIVHTRPAFRAGDWNHYQRVNERFAEVVLEEMASTKQPVVLVQDYHLALLPKLLKQGRPDARVAIFWHIPWPNPEAFGICPWQRELLDGLLGADLAGFHVQSHCNNFLETVDQALESRIEWEHFAVTRDGHRTTVRPFPISVVFGETPPLPSPSLRLPARRALLKELGVETTFLGVGVDRVDYTKGILERFVAIERFLDKYPSYQGRFTFVQIGAPSRTHIKRYHDLFADVEAEAERINRRFQSGAWRPILLRKWHHSHAEIVPFYRAADLCLVTSLHDGMNLVAKEFLAAQDGEQGVLILSRFTGACHELRDALVVNPYDTEETADAIRLALEMDPREKCARMQRMRRLVREHNVYRWAGNLIAELCEIPIEEPQDTQEKSRVAVA